MGRRLVGLLVVALVAGVARGDAAGALRDLRARDAARREAALRELLAAPDEDLAAAGRGVARTVEKLLLRDPEPAVRAAAAPLLARIAAADAVAPLVSAVAAERDASVPRALVAAFARVPGDAARRPLSTLAFATGDARAAALAAEALGALPEGAGRADLLALLDAAPPWAVAAGACLGLAGQRDVRVADALVRRLRHPDAAVRAAARDALVQLTGLDHGSEPRTWEDWWQAEREGFHFPEAHERLGGSAPLPAAEVAPATETSDERTHGDRPTFARFFDIPLTGRRVCFVIDFSQSMWGPRRDRAQQELVDAVKGLSSACTFAVVLFNERVWWFGDGPLPARPQHKLDLVAYLPEQETKSYTNIYDALEQALGLLGVGPAARSPAPGVDDIVLLSDGAPNRGRIKDVERIVEAVTTLNAGRARIHTVSLGEEELPLLPALAAQNGGRHVHHPFAK